VKLCDINNRRGPVFAAHVMHKCGLCRHAIRLSVTFIHAVEMNKRIFNFYRDIDIAILSVRQSVCP